MPANPTPAELVQALRHRPGRGGVRLTYAQADLALELLAAGARAVARERLTDRGPRLIRPHELELDDDEGVVDPVGVVVRALES